MLRCSYHFRVRAMNEVGFSPFHHACEVVRTRTTLPGRPRDVRVWRGAVHSPFSLLVSWRAPATFGGLRLSGYVLHVRAAGESEWRFPSIVELRKPTAAELSVLGKSGPADSGAETPSDSDSDPDADPDGSAEQPDADGVADECSVAAVGAVDAAPDVGAIARVRPERERRAHTHAQSLLRSRYVRVTALEPGVEYAFRVCALSANGASDFARPQPAHVRTACTAPDIVPAAWAIAKGGGIFWCWDRPHCSGGLPVLKYSAALRCARVPPHVDRALVSDEWTVVDIEHTAEAVLVAHTVLWEVLCSAVHFVTQVSCITPGLCRCDLAARPSCKRCLDQRHLRLSCCQRDQRKLEKSLSFWRMRKIRFVMQAWQRCRFAATASVAGLSANAGRWVASVRTLQRTACNC